MSRTEHCLTCTLPACYEELPELRERCPLVQIDRVARQRDQQRYERTAKARQRQFVYEQTLKAKQRRRKYNQSFKGRVARLARSLKLTMQK